MARHESGSGTMMGWVLLEVLAALAIAIAIVWWTFPKPPKGDVPAPKDRPDADGD